MEYLHQSRLVRAGTATALTLLLLSGCTGERPSFAKKTPVAAKFVEPECLDTVIKHVPGSFDTFKILPVLDKKFESTAEIETYFIPDGEDDLPYVKTGVGYETQLQAGPQRDNQLLMVDLSHREPDASGGTPNAPVILCPTTNYQSQVEEYFQLHP